MVLSCVSVNVTILGSTFFPPAATCLPVFPLVEAGNLGCVAGADGFFLATGLVGFVAAGWGGGGLVERSGYFCSRSL